MRHDGIAGSSLAAPLFGFVLAVGLLLPQLSQAQSAVDREPKVSVFFGTSKAMDLGEIKTNALKALKAKGYTVRTASSCVVNVKIQGPQPGCAVMFFDLEAKSQYLVLFNQRGQVSEVRGGPMRHGTVGPNDPLPKFPEGGVEVKP
jgi:hypothetical protein